MATGSGKRTVSFMPTTLPGPAATPTVLSTSSAAVGPGKDMTFGTVSRHNNQCLEIDGLKIHHIMIQPDT